MPLVSGRNAESFDTFDVAEMTDHSQQRNWSSRQTTSSGVGGGAAGGSAHTPWYARHALSPTPETDDITSIGSRGSSSGGRRSEEVMDRVGSMGGGGRADTNNIPRLSQSSTSNSVGSINSYHTNSVSLSNNSDKMNYSYNSHNSGSFNSNVPLYETVDNLDEMQHDPRNPFNRAQGQGQGQGQGGTLRDSWGDHISEEDENSISTMEDSSSVSPSVNNQYLRSQQLQQQMLSQTHTPRSHHHRQQQRHRLSNDTDDSSIVSHQSSRQEFSGKKKTTLIDNSSHIIQQLESQVLKINLELATTKSSLDELQLENRRLTDDKAKMSTDVKLLLQENEQLQLKIERMEREIILRNMESTKGVGTRRSSGESTTGWGGSDTNNVYVTKKRLGKKITDDYGSLQVPFRSAASSSTSSGNEYSLRPKRASLSSVTSSNELHSDDDVGDCRSVALDDCGNNDGDLRNSSMAAEALEHGAASSAQKGGRLGLLNIIGGGGGVKKQPSVREITNQVKETAISYPSSRKNNGDAENEAASSSSRSSPLPKNEQHLEGNKATADDDDIGSNPQGEGEDFNDDDPFSTWSAPGDPKRKETEPEQNWLQRGLGGRVTGGGENSSNSSSNNNNNTKNNSSRPPPQSSNEGEMMTDPFDSYNDDNTERRDGSVGDEYISFADNASGKSEDGDMQDKKRFGLFKGFMGKRR